MKIRIEQDHDPISPRDWDNIGKMVCFHKRYNFGDKHDYKSGNYSGWEELEEAIREEEDVAVLLPLYAYIHGGVTMQTAPFSCPFDSGQVGFIYATKEAAKNYTEKEVTNCLENEVKAYDQYLTGDVWGYIIEDESGEHIDSCWGFFGREFCAQEANEMLNYYVNKEKEWRRQQRNVPCCTM